MQESMLLQVQRVRRLSDRVKEYELADPDQHALPPFTAGSHIDVHVPGLGTRQYSCVRPWSENGPYVIAVQQEAFGRGGSRWIHDNLEPGSMVEISVPRNKFALVKDPVRKILISGGIGITPLLCMALELDEAGLDFKFVVCARDESQLLYSEDLRALQARGHVTFMLSDGSVATRFEFARHFADLAGPAQVYCCGPASLMRAVQDAAAAFIVVTVCLETFGPGQPVAGDTPPPNAEGFSVHCRDSGVTLEIPTEKSILDCLTAASVDVDHSCKEGYCGTCITRYEGGPPLHLDTCLSESERARYIAVCVSRAQAGSQITLAL